MVAGLQSDYMAKQNKDTRLFKICACAITCLETKHKEKRKKAG